MASTRNLDEKISALFSVSKPFSEHLIKREDNQLPDKYDHNSFFYSGQPSTDELRAALAYQKKRGDNFLKLEGYEPLEHSFGMEGEETLTMVLPKDAAIDHWNTNPEVSIQVPDFDQLEQHELKYYGPLYGDDFTVRNNRRLREKLTYLGACLNGKLVGSCYVYSADGYTCMDSLVVNADFRHRYIATTLDSIHCLKTPGKTKPHSIFMQTRKTPPKDMYAKMGFQVTDQVYEYLCNRPYQAKP